MITTTFNKELLGMILAEKFIRALHGNVSVPKLAKRIHHTVLPNGFIINYRKKMKQLTFA